jgi:dipeptidase E
MAGHIVAMGGGGFLMEPDNPRLDDYVLHLARGKRVCYLPTAAGDMPHSVARFYRALAPRCIASDLTLVDQMGLARRPPLTRDLPAYVADKDVLYVAGGNTAHLLALWRLHGLDRAIRHAWDNGAVLAGVSAGMLCWFEGCVTDSFGGVEALHDGLGFLAGSACPHYDGEALRRPTYQRAILDGLPDGYAADDGAALHFEGTALAHVVSSRSNAAAYRVERRGDGVVEQRLEARYL